MKYCIFGKGSSDAGIHRMLRYGGPLGLESLIYLLEDFEIGVFFSSNDLTLKRFVDLDLDFGKLNF